MARRSILPLLLLLAPLAFIQPPVHPEVLAKAPQVASSLQLADISPLENPNISFEPLPLSRHEDDTCSVDFIVFGLL